MFCNNRLFHLFYTLKNVRKNSLKGANILIKNFLHLSSLFSHEAVFPSAFTFLGP